MSDDMTPGVRAELERLHREYKATQEAWYRVIFDTGEPYIECHQANLKAWQTFADAFAAAVPEGSTVEIRGTKYRHHKSSGVVSLTKLEEP